MSQYETLIAKINDMEGKLNKLTNPMIYNYIDENMPDWARPTIQKLVDQGVLNGDGSGLNLTEDMLRILVIMDRL